MHSLPLDKPRPTLQTFDGRFFQLPLSKEVGDQIKSLCETHEVTLFMFLQTAFAVLLSRYSNETDIVMGSAVAGRMHADVENMIGFFLNVLVLRTDLSHSPSFSELLKKNKAVILNAYEHQSIPFEMLVEELSPERHLSHYSVVQILFGVQNNEGDLSAMPASNKDAGGETPKIFSTREMTTRFDLFMNWEIHSHWPGFITLHCLKMKLSPVWPGVTKSC